MTTPTFLFISGCNRSGTTWLTQLLDHHPEARVEGEVSYVRPDETWISRDSIARWTRTGTGATYWRKWDTDRVHRVALRGAIEAVWLDTLRPNPGVRIVGDKAPIVYSEAAERVHTLFPDSYFIDAVRDGRDVAISRVFKSLRRGTACPWIEDPAELERVRRWHIDCDHSDHISPPLLNRDAVRRLASEWRHAVECGEHAAALWGDAYRLIRYEELLRDTASQVESLYTFLGLSDASQHARDAAEQTSFSRVTGREPGEADPNAFVRSASPGEWRQHFNSELEATFMDVAGDTLRRLGYLTEEARTDVA